MINFKKNDLLLILILLALSVCLALACSFGAKGGNTAVVIYDGEEIASFSLSSNASYSIEKEGRKNLLVIEDNYARIDSASCPDKICVHHRKIQNEGETIACLPNKVVVEIRRTNP